MASRIEPALGTVDGVNRDFSAPTSYRAGSLVVFLNGQQLKRELENGWEELDPVAGTFRTKLAPEPPPPGSTDNPGDVLYVYYDLDLPSTGGAEGGIPRLDAGEVVAPSLRAANELRPRVADAEDLAGDAGVPRIGEGTELRPRFRAGDELRPRIIGAKEE